MKLITTLKLMLILAGLILIFSVLSSNFSDLDYNNYPNKLMSIAGTSVSTSITNLSGMFFHNKPTITDLNSIQNFGGSLTIANWNLQIFGLKKAGDEQLMNKIVNVGSKYDIVVFQEIRDTSGDAWGKLCTRFKEKGYNCLISSRAGRSSSKEQYGIVYRKALFIDSIDLNPDSFDRWERPPYMARFSLNNRVFRVWTLHAKPDDVDAEVRAFEKVVDSNDDTIVLGDLNLDCDYADEDINYFSSFKRAINNSMDTTTGANTCTYDRILFNDSFVFSGVDFDSNGVSDHFLVWASFTPN